MEWKRDGNAEISESDYRVQAVRVDGFWRFVAWAPDCGDIRAMCRERYGIGDEMPSRRGCLGAFAVAADARAACNEHMRVLLQHTHASNADPGFSLVEVVDLAKFYP